MPMDRLLACVLFALFGCSTDAHVGNTDGNLMAGSVAADSGGSSPERGDIVAFWRVSSGSPDYDYISTGGSLTPSGFEFPLESAPPTDARRPTLPASLLQVSCTSSAEFLINLTIV